MSLALTLRDAVAAFLGVTRTALRLLRLMLQPKAALAARVLFLEKQLGCFQERQIKPRRPGHPIRASLTFLSRFFDWRNSLVVVQAQTLVAWQRRGWRLYWRWRSRPGRPPLQRFLRLLIRRMARENPTWGQGRIALELALKLGLFVSPRTVAKYMPKDPQRAPGRIIAFQRWAAFLRNHARESLACDFTTVVATNLKGFRILYVFVVMEIGSRKILHWNTTEHPTAAWTTQQLREAIPAEHSYRFLVHDRDAIFSSDLDRQVKGLGVRVLKTPAHAPQANAFCERLIGTLRRECLRFMIVWSERHLRAILKEYVAFYNHARPHMSLGPGFPVTPLTACRSRRGRTGIGCPMAFVSPLVRCSAGSTTTTGCRSSRPERPRSAQGLSTQAQRAAEVSSVPRPPKPSTVPGGHPVPVL